MKVYFISGLAADSRIFRHVTLPPGYEAVHLDWIKPLHNETLTGYALRLADKIDAGEKFVLIGLSMGGMIASEIAKKFSPVATILISSAATHKQFPIHFRFAFYLRLHKLIPAGFLKSVSVAKRLFSTGSVEDKRMITQVITDSDPHFIKWALGAILRWRNDVLPEPLWHIHGSKDEILPYRHIKPTHTIQRGSHLMVVSRAGEVNKILGEILGK